MTIYKMLTVINNCLTVISGVSMTKAHTPNEMGSTRGGNRAL